MINQAIDASIIAELLAHTDTWYHRIEHLSKTHGSFSLNQYLPDGSLYLPTANSISLSTIVPIKRVLEAFSSSLKKVLIERLGEDLVCASDIAWARRQFPCNQGPADAVAHAWHQDGAYGATFLQQSLSQRSLSQPSNAQSESLLPMLTVWIPLHDCGQDAPGIELLDASVPSLLTPDQLCNQYIQQTWPEDLFCRPIMEPTDALIIAADTLHRTHVTRHMTRFRGCIELRFLAASVFSAPAFAKRINVNKLIRCW